jgi:hypothetical protein
MEAIPERLNESRTAISERVHLGEIVVILGIETLPHLPARLLAVARLIACRSPTASI